ncbi:MAG: Flp family type IVb pilin [Coriobacteriia bacterium]|nr:Flp family type IVb pilin [Coriobacteriia bacterium]
MLTKLHVRAQNMMVRDEGATAVEYGIMVAAIAAVIVAVVILLGARIDAAFQEVLDAINAIP